MKKNNLIKSKYFIFGIIFATLFIGTGTYAATTGAGTIGSLFTKIGSVYRLMGDNIENNTIDSSEIEDNTLTSDDLGVNSVGNSELNNTETFNIGRLGIGITNPQADLHIKGDGTIKLDGRNNSNYWVLNAYDDGTDLSISRNGNTAITQFKSNGNINTSGKIISLSTNDFDSGNTVTTKDYVDNKILAGNTSNNDVPSYDNLPVGSLAGYCFIGSSMMGPYSSSILPAIVVNNNCSCKSSWRSIYTGSSSSLATNATYFTCIKE